MKLAFYSGDDNQANERLDLDLVKLMGKKNPKIGYIPSSSDPTRKYFKGIKKYYSKYGLSRFLYFDIDQEFDRKKLPELLTCDAIHLSGGNTFKFLHSIKKRKLVTFLRKYAQGGKVLIGVSAGAMIMTPSINTTAVFHTQKGDLKKENVVGLKDFRALNLVNFEFIPHFNKDKETFVKNYSRTQKNTVCACDDASGIIVNREKTVFYGKVVKF